MAFTGQLGTSQSQLGNILLGAVGSLEHTVTVSSNLNSWQDSTARVLGKLRLVSDTLSLSDATQIILGLRKIIGDDADNWADDIGVIAPGSFFVSVDGTLNNWDDFVLTQKINQATPQLVYKPLEVEYIRRYLNDAVIERTSVGSSVTNVIYKADEITYIRRYLNDV